MKLLHRILIFKIFALLIVQIGIINCQNQSIQISENTIKDKLSLECLNDHKLSIHLQIGNISCALPTKSNRDNYLMIKDQYVISYNDTYGHPNWVSWQLTKDWLGDSKRANDFRSDDSLGNEFRLIGKKDYSKSGFDRGHLCPSGDRTANDEDNSMTFLMTNMMPQAPKNNRGPWKSLEEYERTLAESGKEVNIIAGTYGTGGIGKEGYSEIINDKVHVPNRTWKVLYLIEKNKPRVIAVDMPNSEEIESGNWRKFKTSVRFLEGKTGYDFFRHFPIEIQNSLEETIDKN